MNSNLSRRIEIAYPIESPELKDRLKTIATYYLNDNTKARIIDQHHKNKMVKNKKAKLNAQTAIWQYYVDNLQASIADSEQTFLNNKG